MQVKSNLLGGEADGRIRGSVTNLAGEPLPGTTVTADSRSVQGDLTTTTDDVGKYTFLNLVPGEYTLTFTLEGYQTSKEHVPVRNQGVAFCHATLEPSYES